MHRKKCVARGMILASWGDSDNHRAPLPRALDTAAWVERLQMKSVTLPDGRTRAVSAEDQYELSVRCEWTKEGFDFNDLPVHFSPDY